MAIASFRIAREWQAAIRARRAAEQSAREALQQFRQSARHLRIAQEHWEAARASWEQSAAAGSLIVRALREVERNGHVMPGTVAQIRLVLAREVDDVVVSQRGGDA